TTLNGSSRTTRPAHDMVHQLAIVAHDLIVIGELQIQLFAADLHSIVAGVARAVVFWLVATVLLLAAVTLVLAGLGLLLAEATGVSTGAGLICVALVAVLAIGGLGFAGWRQIQ